jgi:hypothetical protein
MVRSYDTYAASDFNPLNAELDPICHLLALLAAHPILHVSRIRVKVVKGADHVLSLLEPENEKVLSR